MLDDVGCVLSSSVCQINFATSYRTKHFATTVEAIDSSDAIILIICFKRKLLSQGKVLGLFCPKERVKTLERSL